MAWPSPPRTTPTSRPTRRSGLRHRSAAGWRRRRLRRSAGSMHRLASSTSPPLRSRRSCAIGGSGTGWSGCRGASISTSSTPLPHRGARCRSRFYSMSAVWRRRRVSTASWRSERRGGRSSWAMGPCSMPCGASIRRRCFAGRSPGRHWPRPIARRTCSSFPRAPRPSASCRSRRLPAACRSWGARGPPPPPPAGPPPPAAGCDRRRSRRRRGPRLGRTRQRPGSPRLGASAL
jgi:hypothetical protein